MNISILVPGIILLLIAGASYVVFDVPSCHQDICGPHGPLPLYLALIGLVLVGASYALGRNSNVPTMDSEKKPKRVP